MPNIIPTTAATGVSPLMLNEMKGQNEAAQPVGFSGTMGSLYGFNPSGDKPEGGLDVSAAEYAASIKVGYNVTGTNGIRFSAGLSATDLSNVVVGIHMTANAYNRLDINYTSAGGQQMCLINGSGFADYRLWYVGGFDSDYGPHVGYHAYAIDPSTTGTVADTGTFAVTAVDQFAWAFDTGNNFSTNYVWDFVNKFWRVYKTKAGAVGIYGSGGSFENYYIEASTEAWVLFKLADSTYRIIAPFKIGDGTTATTFVDNDSTLFAPTPATGGGNPAFQLHDNSLPFYLDLTTGCSIEFNGTIWNWGVASDFDFDSSIGASVVLDDCIFNGIGNITLGSDVTGDATFSPVSGSDVIINGAILNDSIINGNCQLNSETDMSGMTINGDLNIDTSANSTLTFNDMTVTGLIYNDSSGNTLTINAYDSTVSAGDPGTGNGQTNIQNVVTLEIYGVETGNEPTDYVRCYIEASTGGPETSGTVLLQEYASASDGEGTYKASATYNYQGAQPVIIRARYKGYIPFVSTSTIDADGLSVKAQWIEDTIANV